MIRVSRGRGTMLTAGVTAFVALGALLTVGGPWRFPVAARELTSAEMSATFGDMCYPCMKLSNCSVAYRSGQYDCVKCTGSDSRFVCCPFERHGTSQCNLGAAEACPYAHKLKAPIYGAPLTCDSCRSDQDFQDVGSCVNIKDIDPSGTECPTTVCE
jgi:hypothetical protein